MGGGKAQAVHGGFLSVWSGGGGMGRSCGVRGRGPGGGRAFWGHKQVEKAQEGLSERASLAARVVGSRPSPQPLRLSK